MRISLLSLAVLLAAASACGPSQPAESPTPTPAPQGSGSSSAPAPSADPFAIKGELERETLPEALSFSLRQVDLGRAPGALDAPPASCKAFVGRTPANVSCSTPAEGLAQLDTALQETRPAERDALLAGVEQCPLPAGVVRALRAELAPVECGDALAEPLLKAPPADMDGAVYDTLVGIALGGRLRRAVNTPPQPKPPHDKENLRKFIKAEMFSGAQQQAVAVEALAAQGSRLRYYGRAIVALEAGMADLRFIDALRKLPAPTEFKGDRELEDAYYGSLEQSLDPRKQRGRDATLVGLGQLAAVGVIRDPRVDRAREALTRMYGGRPIDALDQLMLPPLRPQTPQTKHQRLAARLPTFYAGVLLPTDGASEPAFLRQLIEKGVPAQHRIALAKTNLSDDTATLYARARFELAQTYWRAVDIDEMLRLLQGTEGGGQQGDNKLFVALGQALRGGPPNAAVMMAAAPLSELGIGNTTALDVMAQGEGELAAMAAFNSARIAQLAAPATASASYWEDVAKRYRLAAERMSDALDKRRANKLADDAEMTARAITNNKP